MKTNWDVLLYWLNTLGGGGGGVKPRTSTLTTSMFHTRCLSQIWWIRTSWISSLSVNTATSTSCCRLTCCCLIPSPLTSSTVSDPPCCHADLSLPILPPPLWILVSLPFSQNQRFEEVFYLVLCLYHCTIKCSTCIVLQSDKLIQFKCQINLNSKAIFLYALAPLT